MRIYVLAPSTRGMHVSNENDRSIVLRVEFGETTVLLMADAEELTEADPDVLLLHPCGFTIERAWQEVPPLVSRPGWDELRAVRNRNAYLLDGHTYFNRPGPRLVESAEILAEILQPARFSFGHEGTGWRCL